MSFVDHPPQTGDHIWSRARWDEGKQANGVVLSVKHDEIQIRFGDGAWDEFSRDEVECGERVTKAGKTWWILGEEPTPAEYQEKANATRG